MRCASCSPGSAELVGDPHRPGRGRQGRRRAPRLPLRPLPPRGLRARLRAGRPLQLEEGEAAEDRDRRGRPGSPVRPHPLRRQLQAPRAIFTLVTLHVYWGSKSGQDIEERAKELSSIATWLKAWARDPDTWDQNLICLGDFNIDRSGSTLWQAFTSTGLTVPDELQSPNRQVGGTPLEHFYDQIAWFTEEKDGSKPLLSLRYTDRAGMFDWSLTALADTALTGQQKSFRISDHYPLWVEFVVP